MVEVTIVFDEYWLGVIGTEEDFTYFNYSTKSLFLYYSYFIFVCTVLLYGVYAGGAFLLLFIRAVFASASAKRGNKRLHSSLLNHVMRCPISFFDTTPLGFSLTFFFIIS
jgi:ABC-type multidrug transport system fused ATPase/permease subunit